MNFIQWIGSLLHKPERYSELKAFPLFTDLNTYELFQVSNIVNERSYQSGEKLFEQGFPVEAIFFIRKGEIELSGSSQPGGKRVLLKDQIIGLADMFNESTRTSTAQALSKCTVLAISKHDLNDLIANNPRLGNKLLSASCKLLGSHITQFSLEV